MASPTLADGEVDEDEQNDPSDEEEVEEESAEETETEEASGEDPEDEEDVDVEEVELPDDDEQGDGDGDGDSAGVLGGSTFGVSNKVLLGIGISAIVLVLILRSYESSSTRRDYDEGDVEDELEDGAEGAVAEQEGATGIAGGSQYNERADQDAIESVFTGE